MIRIKLYIPCNDSWIQFILNKSLLFFGPWLPCLWTDADVFLMMSPEIPTQSSH